MAAKNNCIKRDVCIFAKESFCSSNGECGHYIMEKGFTSTNSDYATALRVLDEWMAVNAPLNFCSFRGWLYDMQRLHSSTNVA